MKGREREESNKQVEMKIMKEGETGRKRHRLIKEVYKDKERKAMIKKGNTREEQSNRYERKKILVDEKRDKRKKGKYKRRRESKRQDKKKKNKEKTETENNEDKINK